LKIIKAFLKRIGLPFWVIVALPTLFASVYFGLIASSRYVSVSEFVVRSPKNNTSAGLVGMLQGGGFSRSQDDSYVVNQYMSSRDAILELEKSIKLRENYASKSVDILSRFNPTGMYGNLENFFDYYADKVRIELDSTSSISTLTVKAYTAEDAYAINSKLLEMAESLVNKLNERGNKDLVGAAEKQLTEARANLAKITLELSSYRRVNRIFDVDKQAAMQIQLISKLQDQLILVKTQLAQIKFVTPDNPQIKLLEERKRSIEAEVASSMQIMLGVADGNGGNSINQKAGEYEKLSLDKDFAIKQLAAAATLLEQNKTEADGKKLYLNRIVQPRIPDISTEPKRLKNVLTIFLLGLIAWGIFSLLITSVREHGN
jgi:capsular polysaccharide transport system permease protein